MARLGIAKYYVVSHDWGAIIGSVMVADHPDHILGYIRMEADLIRNRSTARIANYLRKPQWVIFQSHWLGTQFMQDPGWSLDRVYGRRLKKPFPKVDRDYLVYEFSRPGVAGRVSSYFLNENRDPDTAIGKICANNFPFPVLQLQADGDAAQPPSIFADFATKCPHVRIEWVKDAGHFDNFDQPGQVADAINRFVHEARR